MRKTKEEIKQIVRGRMQDAPPEFCEWWYPTGVDELSGASVGGHPDAERTWARKDPGRWTRMTFGIAAYDAWNTALYRQEYQAWVAAGTPIAAEPFVSHAVSIPELSKRMSEINRVLREVGKPAKTTTKKEQPKDEPEPIEF